MKRHSFVLSVAFILVMLISAILIGGCSSQPKEKGAEETSAKAVKQEVFNWRMQTTWASGTQYQRLAEMFVEELEQASGGRLKIKIYPEGGIVGANEVFDAVSNNTVEMGHSWAGYWQGKEPAAPLFASVPMGLTFDEYLIWLFQCGGVDLWQELYAKHNLVPIPVAIIGNEVGYVSTKPIKSIQDIKNSKVRNVGLAAKVMTAVGAKVVPLTVAEFYEGIERRIVDAGEYGTPKTNKDLGLYEVAKYWVMPGWHQPSSVTELIINKNAWEKLPEDLRQIIKSVGKSCMIETFAMCTMEDAKAIKELQDNKKIELNRLSEDDLNILRNEVRKIEDVIAEQDQFFKKVLQSQRNFIDEYRPWANAQKL